LYTGEGVGYANGSMLLYESGTTNFDHNQNYGQLFTEGAKVFIASMIYLLIGSTGNSAPASFTVMSTSWPPPTHTVTSCDLPNCFNGLQALLGGIVLVAVLIWVAFRRRRKATVYCEQCGKQNPTANDFCVKCGSPLADTTHVSRLPKQRKQRSE